MPGASSAEVRFEAGSPESRALLTRGGQLAIAAAGFVPLGHVMATVAPLALAANGSLPWIAGAAWSAAILLLVPPLAVRLTWRGGMPPARSTVGGPTFLKWWFSAQWQVLFARLPFLEECLRLVPGLYSAWLRLWGARVGSLVYWSPGVRILDRQWLRIGSRVVVGAGARMNAHALARHRDGPVELFLGAITVEDDAVVGGYSLLLPGCEIAAGEMTPPLRSIHAFSRWARGRHATRTDEGLSRDG